MTYKKLLLNSGLSYTTIWNWRPQLSPTQRTTHSPTTTFFYGFLTDSRWL